MQYHRFLLLLCLSTGYRSALADSDITHAIDEPSSDPSDSGHLKVHLVTWNVNSKKLEDNLEQLLGVDGDEDPDIIAVGFQEVTMKPHKALFQMILDYDNWSYKMETLLSSKGYYKMGTVRLVGIVLNLYTLHKHRNSISHYRTEIFRTGFGGLYGSKGAVYIHFNLFGDGVCLVNAHLTAHDEQVKGRKRDLHLIDDHRRFACQPDNDRYTFWMGDLNFRLEDMSLTAEDIENTVRSGDIVGLLGNDELIKNKERGEIFQGFTEPQINFNPTFKFVVGTDGYNLKRRPAWTDRILYKVNDPKDVEVTEYTSLPTYDTSDHKPVIASYIIRYEKRPGFIHEFEI